MREIALLTSGRDGDGSWCPDIQLRIVFFIARPTAVTREAKNTAVAAQKTLADYEQRSQQNPEKTNMTGSAR
jgi:hypothetical protein